MSEEALAGYDKARKDQVNRNEARHIRNKVRDARNNLHDAGARWPFELLQNASDAGLRASRSAVNLRIDWQGDDTGGLHLVFEHDGAPFTFQDLAALLSGGSSKEFESETTTGRFGTGFLITHVLSEKTRIVGLLATGDHLERFDVTLDRAGDEDQILKNIKQCDEALRGAVPVGDDEDSWSARFAYLVRNAVPMQAGLDAFRDALPYLYSTCPTLGRVTVRRTDGVQEQWTGESEIRHKSEGVCVAERTVRVTADGETERVMRSFRVGAGPDAHAFAHFAVSQDGPAWNVALPSAGFARLFRRFPIRSSNPLPIQFILDGPFDVDEDRRRVHLNERDQQLLKDALNGIPGAIQFAVRQDFTGAHLLARVQSPPREMFESEGERNWWQAALADVARTLARLPIVATAGGVRPAISDSPDRTGGVHFASPRLRAEPSPDEVELGRVWQLLSGTAYYTPPLLPIAGDWTDIVRGWHALGVAGLAMVTLERLARQVRGSPPADRVDALRDVNEPQKWLAEFIDVVGACWKKRGGVYLPILDGLLPDQNGNLKSAQSLKRDGGISEELKDIARSLGNDVRAGLLDTRLYADADSRGLTHLVYALGTAIQAELTEADVIGLCAKALHTRLPKDKMTTAADGDFLRSSVAFLRYLWETQGAEAKETVQELPLVASSGKVIDWAPTRMLMNPVPSWPAKAQPFHDAYPVDRVLSEIYVQGSDDAPGVLPEAFAAWGLAHGDLLCRDTAPDLREARLQAMVERGYDAAGVSVAGQEFSQIALLQDVLNRTRESADAARALLGLVLVYIAPRDAGWQSWRGVVGRRERADVQIRIRQALWLGDLRYRAWIPAAGEAGNVSYALAKVDNLKGLLDPQWLDHNEAAIRLLSECFGFDALELRLLSAAPDEQARMALRDSLARLLDAAGAESEVIEGLVQHAAAQKQMRQRMAGVRSLGLAVQEAIRECLEGHGLTANLVDRGFDYEVAAEFAESEDGSVEDSATRIEVGESNMTRYLVEVKATTSGEVGLTPLQAKTASGESQHYVLCVVDLRTVADDELLQREWRREDVEPLARMVTDIGIQVEEPWELVRAARDSTVAIRNDQALRYGVPATLWAKGMSISDWVDSILRIRQSRFEPPLGP